MGQPHMMGIGQPSVLGMGQQSMGMMLPFGTPGMLGNNSVNMYDPCQGPKCTDAMQMGVDQYSSGFQPQVIGDVQQSMNTPFQGQGQGYPGFY